MINNVVVCDFCGNDIDDEYYSFNKCNKPKPMPQFPIFHDGIIWKPVPNKDMCLNCFERCVNELKNS